jgi:hypothetical protein
MALKKILEDLIRSCCKEEGIEQIGLGRKRLR